MSTVSCSPQHPARPHCGRWPDSGRTWSSPDLVITDLFMPGMSGFSLRASMLQRPDLAAIPVIVLTAYWQRPGETLDAVTGSRNRSIPIAW
jgi:CheY-like chemotaxis protein